MTTARPFARSTRLVTGALSVFAAAAVLLPVLFGQAATPALAVELGARAPVQVAGGKTDRLLLAFNKAENGRAVRVVYPNMVAN